MLPEDVAIKAWTDGGMAAGRRATRRLRPRFRAVDRTAIGKRHFVRQLALRRKVRWDVAAIGCVEPKVGGALVGVEHQALDDFYVSMRFDYLKINVLPFNGGCIIGIGLNTCCEVFYGNELVCFVKKRFCERLQIKPLATWPSAKKTEVDKNAKVPNLAARDPAPRWQNRAAGYEPFDRFSQYCTKSYSGMQGGKI